MTLRPLSSIHSLAGAVMLYGVLMSTSCMPTRAPQSALDSDLDVMRSEFSVAMEDSSSWKELQGQGDLSWRQRAQYDHLTRAVVAYDRAHDLMQRDPSLDETQRQSLRRRQLLRSAHAYFLLGYMKMPLEGRRTPGESADARLAFERGASRARQALGLYMPETTLVRLLDRPTPSLLEQVKDQDALDALYWYTLNTHLKTMYFKTNSFGRVDDVTLDFLEYLADQGPSRAHGSVFGALGTHHARHGRGGGDVSTSKRYFDRGVELGPNNLMLHVMYAEHYAAQTQNALLFDRQIDFVLNAPADLLDSYEQENRLAVSRARQLQARRDDLFY